MFGLFRRWTIKRYAEEAEAYAEKRIRPASQKEEKGPVENVLRYQKKRETDEPVIVRYSSDPTSGVKYSTRATKDSSKDKDLYDAVQISQIMRDHEIALDVRRMLRGLERHSDQTFVERLQHHIRRKSLSDVEVYKTARIDRRLFSKIMSDRQYKPAKDTVITLAIALQLTLDEANDLLTRAGYALSHSEKRDLIIEYFFRERIYNLNDINDVLYRLEQKLIGRY